MYHPGEKSANIPAEGPEKSALHRETDREMCQLNGSADDPACAARLQLSSLHRPLTLD
jgi:hypothetical protein